MNQEELRIFLAGAGLSPSDFGRLVDVTPRAVAMWLSGERAIPGPAAAYARVYSGLPASARYAELQRLKESGTKMRDGMYTVQYASIGGAGYATVILDSGRVYGADPLGGKYDGHYEYDIATGMARVRLKVTSPANVATVFAPAQPFEWSADIEGYMDPRIVRGHAEFTTPLGPKIETQYRFLRELPDAAKQ